MTIGLMLLGMFVLVLINVPVAVALGVVAVAAIWIAQGSYMLPNVALVMFEGATNFPLLAVPLFIFAGGIMNASTISRRLINLATAMLGFIRGGLAMVTVGSSMFFAEISGSAVAGVAALGTLLIPAMKARGYTKEFAAAISSSAASLAIIIPPSIPMILYAAMAEESVVKMFVAGFIPGIIGGLALMLLSYYYARKYDFPVEQTFQPSRLWQATNPAARDFRLETLGNAWTSAPLRPGGDGVYAGSVTPPASGWSDRSSCAGPPGSPTGSRVPARSRSSEPMASRSRPGDPPKAFRWK